MKYVYAKLSRAGFCNLLYPWARAEVFAHRHNLAILNPRWVRLFRPGVWLRKEYHKRYYGGMVTSEGCITGLRRLLILLFKGRTFCDNKMYMENEPDIKSDLVVFEGMAGGFEPLLEYQEYVKMRLLQIANPKLRQLSEIRTPFIGVHIRRGDFCVSDLKTPDAWFVKATEVALGLSEANGVETIRIFSDGYPQELEFMKKAFPNKTVEISPKVPAICDLLRLSQSKVLVASPQSTFSAWAVFLGQMPSVWKEMQPLDKVYSGESKAVFVE